MRSSPTTSQRPSGSWIYFVLWMLVGASYATVVAGAFSVGIFFIPVAVLATVLLSRTPSSRHGLSGLWGGPALPLLYVAYLNRGGPGMVCTTTHNAFGVGQSCIEKWNPWIWLATALVLLGVGVFTFTLARRRRNGLEEILA